MSTALDTSADEIRAVIRAMRRLADLWRLEQVERAQLTGSDDLELYERDPGAAPDDLQRRWGRLLTIIRLRRMLMPTGNQASWVRSRGAGGELVIDLLINDPQRLEMALESELANCIAA